MLAALYRWGPPRRVGMLASALAAQAREGRWRRYVADMAYNIVALLCGGDPGVPSLSELEQPADRRSEAQIAREVIARLTKEEGTNHEAI